MWETRAMQRFAINALAAACVAAPLGAAAQSAAPYEVGVIQKIAPCLVQGAPGNWLRIYMIVELQNPGDDTGGVRYLVSRQDAPDKPEPLIPCDIRGPAKMLLGIRAQQAPDKARWIGARFVLLRDGSFSLGYDFPESK